MKTFSFSSFSRRSAGERGLQTTVSACLSLLLLLVPAAAFAWGQATHAYFAKELGQEELNSQEIYGAASPDLFNLMLASHDYDYLVDQTHDHFSKLGMKARRMRLDTFAFGFVSHNEVWGADYTAHKKGRTTGEGYVITKSRFLAPKIKSQLEGVLENAGVQNAFLLSGPLASELAHPLVETAIDLLIKRNEDPFIGTELFQSARDRPPEIPDLLAEVYGKGLARHLKISAQEATEFIKEAETGFQQLMILYGEILGQEEQEAIRELAEQGTALINSFLKSATGKDASIPPEVLTEFINLALFEVEEDYGQEIAATLSYLRHRSALVIYLHSLLKRDRQSAYQKFQSQPGWHFQRPKSDEK